MQYLSKFFIAISLLVITVFSSCGDEDRKGCTDPEATNYNVLAKEDDGTCEYLDSSFTIYSNNALGYWGSPATGSFSVGACMTNEYNIFMNPDTTIIPPDTIIDNNVTPPDTTYVPADTTITGDTYLLVNSDSMGNYALVIKLLNPRSAIEFKKGYLQFDAMLHPDAYNAGFNDFGLMIYGNQANPGGSYCEQYRHSTPLSVFTSVLDTSSFQQITVPLEDFDKRYMQMLDVVFAVKGGNAPVNTNLLILNNIRWVTNLEQ